MPGNGHTGGVSQTSQGIRPVLPVHLSIFRLKHAEKRSSKLLQPEIMEKSGNLTEVTANTGTNRGY